MNVNPEQRITICHVLRKDTSGPVIFNAPAIAPLNPVKDLSLSGIRPAGTIMQSYPAAEQSDIIANRANNAFIQNLFTNYSLSHALLSYERASKSRLQERRITSDD